MVRIDPSDRIYVTRPADGAYRGKVYAGSGDELLRTLVAALVTHTSAANLLTADSAEVNVAASLERARGAGAAYLLQPAIVRWEERATQWSASPITYACESRSTTSAPASRSTLRTSGSRDRRW